MFFITKNTARYTPAKLFPMFIFVSFLGEMSKPQKSI